MSNRDSDAIDQREKGVLEEINRLARPSMPHTVQNILWAAGLSGLFLSVSILVREQDLRLKELLGAEAATLPELALRFTLQHEAVSTVIPGMRTSAHVASNLACAEGKKFSDELMAKLRTFTWDRTGEW